MPSASPTAPAPAAPAGAPAPTPRVELHVESLLLTGFRPEHRHRIGAAPQGELTRLLEERGVPDRLEAGLDAALLRAAAVDLSPDAAPAVIGARLARSVYGALGGAGPVTRVIAPPAARGQR